MKNKINFDKIAVGEEIPSLEKHPTTRQLVMWAGASGDYNPIHYDREFALSRSLTGVVVHGQLSTAFICQMLSDWYGQKGTLKKLNVTYKGLNFPGDTLVCHGTIREKSDDGIVALDVRVENQRGEKTVVGSALVKFQESA
jgi:acyl dehydratase